MDHIQNLQRRISQQATRSAQSFYGNPVGGLKSRVQSDRAQFENLAQQMREGSSKAQVREMIDSYNELEISQDQGVKQAVSQTLPQARQSANGAVQQARQTGGNGGVVDEDEAGNVADLPVEEEYVDERGRVVSQVSDDAGNAYELESDDGGDMVEARAV